jgi:signal transduction histidine kinase
MKIDDAPEDARLVARRGGVTPPPLTILLVEDNPGDARLVRELLDRGRFGVEHVERLADAEAAVARRRPDVVFLDLSLPDASQAETIDWMTAVAPRVPIVVFTGRHDEELAAELVRAGVQDYLEKTDLHAEVLARTARHAVERARFRAELEAMRTRQLRAKDELLGHVSHELRTPLNAVYQFATLLRDGVAGELGAEQRDCVDVVLRNVEQLRRMIADLLDATRAESGTLAVDVVPLALAPLLVDTLRSVGPVADARGIALEAQVPDDLPPVRADATRVGQVVVNLLDNALKFTPRGGRVTLAAAAGPDAVAVTVADTGVGIARDEQERVFERLYQVSGGDEVTRKGLGIGLHLCREFVRRMGGRITVESAPGRGSRFTFTLGRADAP